MLYYIGISGKIGSGKDTVADFMTELFRLHNMQSVKISFAKDLKLMAQELFGFTDEELYKTKPSNVRLMLQKLGTDVIRRRDQGFWIRQLEWEAKQYDNPLGVVFVLVPDVRFENEARFIKDDKKGKVFRIERNNLDSSKVVGNKHASETEMENKSYLCETIYNPSDFNELRERVRTAMKPILSCHNVDALIDLMQDNHV